MQTERNQSWIINVQAKANDFNFRFRASILAPTCSRFSFVLKLRKFVFKLNSDPTPSISFQRRKSLKSKIIGVFHKFRAPFVKNRDITSKKSSIQKHPKDVIRIGCWFFGFIAFLAQSIWAKDKSGTIILTLTGFVVGSLFMKYKTGKYLSRRVVFMAAVIVGCFLFLDLDDIGIILDAMFQNLVGDQRHPRSAIVSGVCDILRST